MHVVPIYSFLKQGSRRIPTILRNISCQDIILKKGSRNAEVKAANIAPHMLAPKENERKRKNTTFPYP